MKCPIACNEKKDVQVKPEWYGPSISVKRLRTYSENPNYTIYRSHRDVTNNRIRSYAVVCTSRVTDRNSSDNNNSVTFQYRFRQIILDQRHV